MKNVDTATDVSAMKIGDGQNGSAGSISYQDAEAMADRLLALRMEENDLKKKMVSAMRDLKLDEIRTDAGLISFVETKDMLTINKVRMEEILVRRFNLNPAELKSAIEASHDCKVAEAHVCIWSGERYAKKNAKIAA